MNIFYLSDDVQEAAKFHCDKHVIKMMIEYAQLLSTAHRLLDGKLEVHGKKKFYLLDQEWVEWWNPLLSSNKIVNQVACKQSHVNHPSAIWVRQSEHNYRWLYNLLMELQVEWNRRYPLKNGGQKVHATIKKYSWLLANPPKNIPKIPFTRPPACMPEHLKQDDIVEAYRQFYIVEKSRFATWKNEIPSWYSKVVI